MQYFPIFVSQETKGKKNDRVKVLAHFLTFSKLTCEKYSCTFTNYEILVCKRAYPLIGFCDLCKVRNELRKLRSEKYRQTKRRVFLPRKEVIQPQIPLRLPCFDFILITDSTLSPLHAGFRVAPALLT